MVVLSLFDGMGCGMIALRELGVQVDKYYSSEVDKHCIKQVSHNFPDVIHLGDIKGVNVKDLGKVDLVIGGSPCQGFSFAGKRLNFDDPRSVLFFEFVRVWHEVKKVNPDVKFLLENVNMKKEWLRVISEYMGVFPVRINSNLVSAQNRDRWYWSNIRTKDVGLFSEVWTDIPQPEDRGILLKDILEDEVNEKYYMNDKWLKWWERNKEFQLKKGYSQVGGEKTICHTTRQYASWNGQFVCTAMRGREDGQQLEPQATGKTNAITSVSKDNLILSCDFRTDEGQGGKGHLQKNDNKSYCVDTNNGQAIEIKNTQLSPYQGDKIHYENDKMQCLSAQGGNNLHGIGFSDGTSLRRLTPLECSRLQTIPEWYKWVVSDSQIYKMLGNGWTVEIIKHIFSFL